VPLTLFVAHAHAANAARMRSALAGRAPIIPRVTPRTVDGRVVEVRRSSRELTVRTPMGTIEHVVVPAAVHGPHGNSVLGEIRAGMSVHAEGEMNRERVIARTIAAH
jgi:hypothetical protein